MKYAILFLLITLCLTFAGCSKSADVDALMKESDAVRDELIQKIQANPTLAGIDDAQKVMDAKKAAIRQRADALKNAYGFQVNSEQRSKMSANIVSNNQKIVGAIKVGAVKGDMNPQDMVDKTSKLTGEYGKAFSIENN